MAIPPTGSTITMTDIRDFFVGGGFTSSFVLGILGTYIGISQGTTITMSSTFGGFGQSSTPGSFSLVSTSPTLPNINPTSEENFDNPHIAFDEWNGVSGEYMFVSGYSFGAMTCGVVNVATGAELFTFNLSSDQNVIMHPTGIQSNDLIFKIISSTTTGPIIYHYNHSGSLVRSIGPISGQTLNNFGDIFYNPNNGRYYGLNEASANSFYGIRKFNTSTTPEASFAIPNPIDGFTWDRQFTVKGQVCSIPNKNAILYTVLFRSSAGLYKYATLSFDMDDEQWYVIAGSPPDPSGALPALTSPFDGVTAATEIFDQCLSADGTTICLGLKQGTSSVWYNGYVDPTAQWEFGSAVNLDSPDLQTAGTDFFTNRTRKINTVYGAPGAFVESFSGSTFDSDPEPGRSWLYSRATSFEFSTFTIIESISGDDLPTFPPSPTYMPRFYPIYDTTTGPKKIVQNGTANTQTMMCGGVSSTSGASTSNDKVYRINVPTVGGAA